MKPWQTPHLAWWIAGTGLVLSTAALILGYVLRSYSYLGAISNGYDPLIGGASVLASLLVGGLIASRLPGNPYGWIWIFLGLGSGVMQPWGSILVTFGSSFSTPQSVLTGIGVQLAAMGWVLSVTMLPFALLLFPTGRIPSPRWQIFTRVILLSALIAVLTIWAVPGESGVIKVENPFGLRGAPGQIAMGMMFVSVSVILLGFIIAALSLVSRYRRGTGVEKLQLTWLAFAGAINIVVFLLDLSELHQPWIPEDTMTRANGLLIMTLPIVVGMAVLRYRLYNIDLIIRRTLVYGALTATLALVYFGSVTLAQSLFVAVSGERSSLAIVISTLAIAGLFSPLRRRIQSAIDRRFFRRKYDAAQSVSAFSLSVRDEVDMENLSKALLVLVEDTLQPESVSLWFRESLTAGPD